MVWRACDPQGNETGKVRWDVVPFTRGIGADIGCGPTKLFPWEKCIGVDNLADVALFGIQMRPDVPIADAADLPFKDETLDYVFSSHMLEHVVDPVAVLREMWRCLKDGGYLVLYLPHADLYPRMGQPGANPDHKHDFVPKDIGDLMSTLIHEVEGSFSQVLCETRNEDAEYSFLVVYQKNVSWHTANDPREWHGHQDLRRLRACDGATMFLPLKTACVVRYGGFGDQIQASNILPELKRQGYHVTFMTTPKGRDILAHDPHIDAWFIQDNDQVPNSELHDFWRHHAARFDRFINLSESVEGTLLALPGRANHAWQDAMRRRELGRNYLEFTADIAELPYRSEARFYPSDDERQMAKGFRDGLRGGSLVEASKPLFLVMLVLSGSSVHKFYPGQDVVVDNLLRAIPDAQIITVGDAACYILEAGYESNPRIHCQAGKLGIRDTMALAQVCNLVIGPETGVLNAVAFDDVAKVVLLSHSSTENLTKHWVNAAAMLPRDTPCYPCHRLHYGRDYCPEDAETGAAMCQKNIDPRAVVEACLSFYRGEPVPRPRRTLQLVPA